MKVVNEISYNYVTCPTCFKPLSQGTSDEYIAKCSECFNEFRVIQETVTRCTSSVIK
jgi:hypothetical protein